MFKVLGQGSSLDLAILPEHIERRKSEGHLRITAASESSEGA